MLSDPKAPVKVVSCFGIWEAKFGAELHLLEKHWICRFQLKWHKVFGKPSNFPKPFFRLDIKQKKKYADGQLNPKPSSAQDSCDTEMVTAGTLPCWDTARGPLTPTSRKTVSGGYRSPYRSPFTCIWMGAKLRRSMLGHLAQDVVQDAEVSTISATSWGLILPFSRPVSFSVSPWFKLPYYWPVLLELLLNFEARHYLALVQYGSASLRSVTKCFLSHLGQF